MLKRQKDTQIKGTYLPKPSKFNKISTIYLSYENINFKKNTILLSVYGNKVKQSKTSASCWAL